MWPTTRWLRPSIRSIEAGPRESLAVFRERLPVRSRFQARRRQIRLGPPHAQIRQVKRPRPMRRDDQWRARRSTLHSNAPLTGKVAPGTRLREACRCIQEGRSQVHATLTGHPPPVTREVGPAVASMSGRSRWPVAMTVSYSEVSQDVPGAPPRPSLGLRANCGSVLTPGI